MPSGRIWPARAYLAMPRRGRTRRAHRRLVSGRVSDASGPAIERAATVATVIAMRPVGP